MLLIWKLWIRFKYCLLIYTFINLLLKWSHYHWTHNQMFTIVGIQIRRIAKLEKAIIDVILYFTLLAMFLHNALSSSSRAEKGEKEYIKEYWKKILIAHWSITYQTLSSIWVNIFAKRHTFEFEVHGQLLYCW